MKLHQLLAFEKDARKRAQTEMTEVHRASGEEKLLQGVTKRYQPVEEGGTQYPPERSPVNLRHQDAIKRFRAAWCEESDIVARKDFANVHALADIVVDGEVLLRGVPATHLLFIEKHLEHARTFLTKLVELQVGAEWLYDETLGMHKTTERMTQRTEKTQEPIVLYDATEKHPAQTQLITRDTVVGHWFTTFYSGGITADKKRELLTRVAKLSDAVKEARERANSVEVGTEASGAALMDFIFGRGA